jgi:hypothetical protein
LNQTFYWVTKKDFHPSPLLTRGRKSTREGREKEVESNILLGNQGTMDYTMFDGGGVPQKR